MSEATKAENEKDAKHNNAAASRAAFCPNMAHVKSALSLLYLKNNASARNKFGDTYPEVANYIFGDELIAYDHEGCTDYEHRSALEEEALQRRFELLKVLDEVEDKSVDAGSLQKEYVERILDHFGAGVCSFIYTEEIIERVRPGLLKTLEEEKKSENGESSKDLRQQAQADLDNDTSLLAAEQEILASKPKDTTNVPISDIEDELEEGNKEPENKEPENPAPDSDEIEKELEDIKPIDMHDGKKEGGENPAPQGEAVPSDVARQSVEIGADGAENKELPAAPSAPAAPEQSEATDSNPAPPPPESKPEMEAGSNPAPSLPPETKAESNPAPPVQSSNPAPPPPPPSEPEQKAPQAPDIKKTELGPPLKEEEKKEAPSIFGKKPDFANMKASDAPKEEEAPLQSYKDLFNTLAAKAA